MTPQDAAKIIDHDSLYPVFLPSAEAYVFSERMGQIHQLMDIPHRIVLSTNFNPGSSPVLSPLIVMSLALLRYRVSDPFLLINAFTHNPASMLYLTDRGKIEKGTKADLICMPLERFEQIPYWATLHPIHYVIKNGQVFEPNQRAHAGRSSNDS
jgi:imidazolonepropionase